MKYKILGIDGGFANIGWAILSVGEKGEFELIDHGLIETKKKKKSNIKESQHNLNRALKICDDFSNILSIYSPAYASIEGYNYVRNAQSAVKNGIAYGVISACCRSKLIPLFEVDARFAKEKGTGNNKAKKEDVIKYVQEKYGPFSWKDKRKQKLEHQADAILIAESSIHVGVGLKVYNSFFKV